MTYIIVIAFIVLLLVLFLKYQRARVAMSAINDSNDAQEKITQILLIKIRDVEATYFPQTLAFELYLSANQKGLSFTAIESIAEKYGKAFSYPVISWTNIFKDYIMQFSIVYDAIGKYLEINNYIDNPNDAPSDRFDAYLRFKATLRAKEIINDL